jgi:hypothetical protein
MKTLGDSMGKFLSLIIFKIILVLYILYLVVKIIVDIGVGSISGVSAKREQTVDELRWSLTGKNTMVPVQNSKKI